MTTLGTSKTELNTNVLHAKKKVYYTSIHGKKRGEKTSTEVLYGGSCPHEEEVEGAVRGSSKEMHIVSMCLSLKNAWGRQARTWKGFGSLLSSNGLSAIVIEISRARAFFYVFFVFLKQQRFARSIPETTGVVYHRLHTVRGEILRDEAERFRRRRSSEMLVRLAQRCEPEVGGD